MPLTNFPNGISSNGVPVYGGLPYSSLIGPKGKAVFCAPYRTASSSANSAACESSDSNDGTFLRPFKTIAAAYAACNGNRGEVIYLMGYSNSAADVTDDWDATFTWSKSFVHLVGLVPPMAVSHRARINQLSTATGVSPLLNVTGHGNVFANFQIFQGVDDDTSLVNVQVTGQHNVFDGVHIAGVGHATMSASGCASLNLEGGSENVFKGCTIGVDTVDADADGTNITMDGGASRMLFEDCLIQMYVTNASAAHVRIVDSTGIDRWIRFRNCLFSSKSTNKAVDMAEVFAIGAGISQGAIILENCAAHNDGGAPVWTAGTEGIIWANMPAPTASAAGGLMTNL